MVFFGGLLGLLTLQVMRYTPPESAAPMGKRSRRIHAKKQSKRDMKIDSKRDLGGCDG